MAFTGVSGELVGKVDTDLKTIEISRYRDLCGQLTIEIRKICEEIMQWKEARSHCVGSMRRDRRGNFQMAFSLRCTGTSLCRAPGLLWRSIDEMDQGFGPFSSVILACGGLERKVWLC